ncbi:MAG: DUF1559 domain-containing protein [Planctomycetia bacterium]|nr:DUF1559 domain-containing protein [Planctomycetia bacterium]
MNTARHAERLSSSHRVLPCRAGRRTFRGFTLVELLVVISIIGTLIGLLLPSVQNMRETSRRTTCTNNMRQMGVGLTSFESARRRFPAGTDDFVRPGQTAPLEHAWSSYILPHIEQIGVSARIDYTKHWNAPGANDAASDIVLPLYVCPSGIETFPGKQDYGGVLGSAIALSSSTNAVVNWDTGILRGSRHPVSGQFRWPTEARMVSDGLSKTLLVAEAVDRKSHTGPSGDGNTNSSVGSSRWACGTNCFLHNSPAVNDPTVDGFRSRHPRGLNCVFADGHVVFLSDSVDSDVVVTISTASGGEAIPLDL